MPEEAQPSRGNQDHGLSEKRRNPDELDEHGKNKSIHPYRNEIDADEADEVPNQPSTNYKNEASIQREGERDRSNVRERQADEVAQKDARENPMGQCRKD